MHFLQRTFLLFLVLFCWVHEVWPMETEQPKKTICLMTHPTEYASEEWLPEYKDYLCAMGRQQQRLESEKEYTPSYVRFVKDIPSLAVGYQDIPQKNM